MLKLIESLQEQSKANKDLLRMKLQFFAEPEGGDDGSVNPEDVNPDDIEGDKKNDSESSKSFTQEELDNIVQREKAKAKTQAEKEYQSKVEAAAQAKIDEAEKLKNMNEDERTQHEKEKLENELSELRRDKSLREMGEEATAMLNDKNIKVDKDVLAFVVNEDAEITSQNVEKFAAIIDAQRELIRQEFNKKLGGRVPLDGTQPPETLSEAAKLAKERNERNKSKPDAYNPWKTN